MDDGLTLLHCFTSPEIGINFQHIKDKSLTVLNPFHSFSASHQRDTHLMDDADLAGPLLFCFALGVTLLLVSLSHAHCANKHLYSDASSITLTVWQIAIRIHLRGSTNGRYRHLSATQHDVGRRYRCISRLIGSWLLHSAALPTERHLDRHQTRVSAVTSLSRILDIDPRFCPSAVYLVTFSRH
jgi:hypothetical protein